ncbi:hypothetical protein [Heyndrickxia sporothermodurans]|nr:hypothetical protein [Heyndrickxia sporothermodurans]
MGIILRLRIEYDSIPPIAKLQLENLKGTKKESIKELVTAL